MISRRVTLEPPSASGPEPCRAHIVTNGPTHPINPRAQEARIAQSSRLRIARRDLRPTADPAQGWVRPMPLGVSDQTPYVVVMSSWSASRVALAALACSLALPAAAEASSPEASASATAEATPKRKRDRVRALEIQGLGMTQLLPRPGFGGDLAFSFGFPNFQARVGAMIVGVPPFRLGQGEIGNVLHAGTLDLCAAKPVLRHQIRMCVGGQAGGMSHLWRGYDNPKRKLTAWASGTLKGDYQLSLTDRFGVIFGVGMVIPVVGPSFRDTDPEGSPTPVVFPGPMAGYLSLGTTVRW